jgi:acyl-CoA reductase-like NAD-dependent aldehyde dehydrogenase
MSLTIINPSTRDVVRTIETDDEAARERKLDRAHAAAADWRRVPLAQRIEEVRAAMETFRRDKEAIAREISVQMGKPVKQARGEVDTMLDRVAHMLSIAPESLAPEELPEKTGFARSIVREPLGVVLDIAAWNYPLLVPVNVVVPGLVAGNVVVLKHSPKTPLTGVRFEQAFARLSVPGAFTHVVVADSDAGSLVADPRIDHVAFTGSVKTGKSVYQTVGKRLIGAGLELGGKDPAYVAEDADLDFAAENVVDGACYNAGQSCCAVERVFVHESVYERFLERALKNLAAYKLGDPLDDATTMGPLVDERALEAVDAQVRDARSRGARVACGGKRWSGSRGFYYEPTLLADCPVDAQVMREETFGPVVPVRAVKSDAEALALMNDSRYGLTASIWTKSAERADRMARDLEVGTVYQNRCDFLDPALPWTGVKESGLGSTLSHHGYLGLTRPKSLHFRR